MTYDVVTEMITSPKATLEERQKNSSLINDIPSNIIYEDKQDIGKTEIPLKVIKTSR